MKRFDITFKNEKENSVRFIILLLVLLHVLFFVSLLFNGQLWKKGVGCLVITLLYSGYRLLITNTSKQKFSFGSGYFFVLAIIFISSVWWLNIIELILYVLSSIALSPIILAFTTTDIRQSKFPFKKYQWNELSNVILKDNLLTLDFKNNNILQAKIEPAGIKEDAFNTFANEQLNKH